ncbi:MAG: hypothetical protein ACREUD_01140 [Gammaproteobacteria bacterium]
MSRKRRSDPAFGLQDAARDPDEVLARLVRGQEAIFSLAPVDEDLHTRLARVEVLDLPARRGGLQRERRAHRDRDALGVREPDRYRQALQVRRGTPARK